MIAIVSAALDSELRGNPLPSGTAWGTYWRKLADGRVAMPYEFSDDDIAFLIEHGGKIVDVLPEVMEDGL